MSAPAENRDPHQARMDEIYRWQRHIYDVTRKYYLLGRDAVNRSLAPPVGGTVLEIGCGTARNLVAIAQLYPRTDLYGIDISREMLASARAKISGKHLGSRVFVREADAICFDAESIFSRGRFDRILFSYTLSMIPDWKSAIRHAASMLEPGGFMEILDFGDQGDLPKWFGQSLRKWLTRFDVFPRDDLADWLRDEADGLGLAVYCRQIMNGYAMRVTAIHAGKRQQVVRRTAGQPSQFD